MPNIETRITEAWANYFNLQGNNIKPKYLCLSNKDHYALSKSTDSEELIRKWNGIEILLSLNENSEIIFIGK